jgi:DNA-binding NarL/FixJ family response regulator
MDQSALVRAEERERNRPLLATALWPQDSKPTERELQVLRLICDGSTSKEIAAQLGISFKTATCHRAKLLSKAVVHSSIALFRWALKNGFVSPIEQFGDERLRGGPNLEEATCLRNPS